MGSLPYFLLSKLQKSHFFPKPLAKFWVLMIHALMLKLHLIYKVGRVGPWNPIQHPSFWKTTYYITNFSSGCWTSIPLRIVIPDKGQFFPLHQGHKESVFSITMSTKRIIKIWNKSRIKMLKKGQYVLVQKSNFGREWFKFVKNWYWYGRFI